MAVVAATVFLVVSLRNTIVAENEPKKIWLVREEAYCLQLNNSGGLRALAVDGKIIGKEKELFWRKLR